MANLKQKSSRTTSEFSVIDEKLSLSIVKLAGSNEIPETFWKSVGPAVWTYTEIPKGQRYKLLMLEVKTQRQQENCHSRILLCPITCCTFYRLSWKIFYDFWGSMPDTRINFVQLNWAVESQHLSNSSSLIFTLVYFDLFW